MDFKEKIAAITTFSIIVSCCYLFGYWGSFNINILEFGNLTDLAKLAIFPMLTGLIFFLTGTLTTEIAGRRNLPTGGGRNTAIGQFGRKHWRWLVAGQITFTAGFSIFGPEPWKWVLVAFLLALLSTPLTHLDYIIKRLPDPELRARVLYWLLLLPAAAFAHGRIDAFNTKEGHAKQVVDVTRSGLQLVSTDKKKVAYLGFVGGLHILYETATGSVIISKQKDDALLVIVPNYEMTLLGKVTEDNQSSPVPSPVALPASAASGITKSK